MVIVVVFGEKNRDVEEVLPGGVGGRPVDGLRGRSCGEEGPRGLRNIARARYCGHELGVDWMDIGRWRKEFVYSDVLNSEKCGV